MSADIDPHVTKQYDINKRIGKGAYGIVWKAVDKRSGEIIALKKIFDAFTNCTDAQRTYREIMFLQAFSSHENVIKLLNVIKADNDFDIYLVFEFMDTDLHVAIKARILQDVHKQYILYQLFKVIKYLHSGNVIHRDLKVSVLTQAYEEAVKELCSKSHHCRDIIVGVKIHDIIKPSNVLLNAECFVKLADFGLARSLGSHDPIGHTDIGNAMMTDYVATRWYRAPEILLASPIYTKGVDMWSLGCILAEMVSEKPLFAGSSTINQIDKIMCCVAPPTRHDLESIRSPYAASILSQIGRRKRRTFAEILPTADPLILDVVGKLLHFNPTRRLTALQALEHPYVAKFHDRDDEPSLDHNIIPLLDDNVQLTVEDYRDNLYENVKKKRHELQRAYDAASRAAGPEDKTDQHTPIHSPLHSHSATELHRSPVGHVKRQTLKSSSATNLATTTTAGVTMARPPPAVSSAGLRSHLPHRTNDQISINKTPVTTQPAVAAHIPKSRPISGSQVAVAKRSRHGDRSHEGTSIPYKQQQPLDLCVVSGRIIPSERELPVYRKLQLANKKAARGTVSKYAPGSYAQTFGVIKQSDLHALRLT